MKIRPVLVLNLSVLFLVTPALTFANEKPEILNVVEAFCKLDFEGARLSSRTWHRITPYVTWEDEPGWDIALAIKSYRIGTVSVDRQKAHVTVWYDIARSCPRSFEPAELRQFQMVRLELIRKNSRWLIDSRVLYPRVSSDILCERYGCCD